jgi:hypothetical protein
MMMDDSSVPGMAFGSAGVTKVLMWVVTNFRPGCCEGNSLSNSSKAFAGDLPGAVYGEQLRIFFAFMPTAALTLPSGPLGVHHQQYDSADERQRSDNRRDKVADGGLKVHAEEFDRLSRGREGDAGVSEHHDAQSDQKDCDNGFCIHIDSFIMIFSVNRFLIQWPAPGDEVDEHHDNGNDQQDVNKPAQRVTAHQTEQPKSEQHHRNCV